MKEEILENVLTELSEEIKQLRIESKTNIELQNNQSEQLKILSEKVKDNEPLIPVKTILEVLRNGINDINQTVRQQPKEILQEKRVLLFPEGDSQNFFKYVINKLIIGLVIFGLFYSGILAFKELSNYRKAYQYIYYSNEKNQEYLQDVMYKFSDKLIDNEYKKDLSVLKKNSENKLQVYREDD